jgi:hypothetical protein
MTKDRARQKAAQYREWADKADKKARVLQENWSAEFKDFDWTQPILRGHHSQRRHEKVYERRNAFHQKLAELEAKAKRFREKADNLEAFANTNKGDAERRRTAEREKNDTLITVGTRIHDPCFRGGEVIKVNKKTYTIKFDNGGKFTRDKSYVQIT